MSKKGDPSARIAIYLAIILVSGGLLVISDSSITGNAVLGEDYIGVLEGTWDTVEILDERHCKGKEETQYVYPVSISQSNDKVTMSSQEFVLSGGLDADILSLKGIFNRNKGDVNVEYGGLRIAPDCNSFEGVGKWSYKGKRECTGTSKLVGTRQNPVGCQTDISNLEEDIINLRGEWHFVSDNPQDEPFNLFFTQAGKQIEVTRITGGDSNEDASINLVGMIDGKRFTLKGLLKGGGVTEIDFAEAILGHDCDVMRAENHWKEYNSEADYSDGEEVDSGVDQLTGTRVNPNGECKYLSKAAPETCEEQWSCGSWSECSAEGKQTRSCEDAKSCGTVTSKPSESKSCEAPQPAPRFDYAFVLLLLVLIAVVAGVIYLLVRISGKKKVFAKQIEETIDRVNADIARGDKVSALQSYKTLTMQFEKFKDHLKEEDLARIYDESVSVYQKIAAM